MLQPEPTRIELRAEDKEEYTTLRREQQEARLAALARQTGKQPLTPLFVVEIKLRLKDAEAHARLAAALKASYRTTHEQENYFFDGSGAELSRSRTILRLRFYNFDKRALLTVKGKQVLVDGVGRCPETEVEVPPPQARAYLTEPNKLLEAGLPLVDALNEQHGLTGLKSLGGFRNIRQEFNWSGLVLELDQTRFEHGTVYELEAETAEPEAFKPQLEALLTGHGVAFSNSGSSKFANFINKTLL